jgi:sugar/nucleoside kinase (ribokinase family)
MLAREMAPDFVAIGHVTLDETAKGTQPGGAALYALLTAVSLGCSSGLLTSFGPDFPREVFPPDLQVVNVPATRTTTFRHEVSPRGRRLTLLHRATDLVVDYLPEPWKGAGMVLLCPVANEVDPFLAAAFTDGAVGAAVQGWMRERGAGGAITPSRWEDAPMVLPHLQAVFLSREETGEFEEDLLEWFQQIPVGVLTLGEAGTVLFVAGERYEIQADAAQERDATGAGDVFAAAFLIHYQREGDPWEAAAYASCAAACSVEAEGIAGIPDPLALEARLVRYRRRLGGELS